MKTYSPSYVFRPFYKARIAVGLLVLLLSVLLMTAGSPRMSKTTGRSESPANPTTPPDLFTVDPSQLVRGITQTVFIRSTDCAERTFQGDDSVITKDEIDALKNKGIELKSPKRVDECRFTAEFTPTENATFGPVAITINYLQGETKSSQVIFIFIVGQAPLPPGPLVPGLPPQVDIMWSVVPNKIVKDNFGARVGKLFYCLEIVIGNDTGYDLQIASVGFYLGPVGRAATAMSRTYRAVTNELAVRQKEVVQGALASLSQCDKGTDAQILKCKNDLLAKQLRDLNASQSAVVDAVREQADMLTKLSRVAYAQKLPVSSYRMTRGSIEHGQFLSFRNLGLNVIRTAGPILTGFLPFFHNMNHQTNFSIGINILNNPIEKGFEILVPDETIVQMQRLDDDMLRDGMIVPNNRQIRTRVFIPKDILKLQGDLRDDPVTVTQALGELYLIGDTIQFINRISVTSTASGEVLPSPRVTPLDINLTIGMAQTFSVTGTFLNGAILTPDDRDNITVNSFSTTSTSAQYALTISDKAAAGPHNFLLSTSGGTTSVPVNFIQPKPEPDTLKFDEQPTIRTPGKEFKFTITGRFFQRGTLTVAPESSQAIELVPNSIVIKDSGTTLTGKLRVLDAAESGVDYFLLLTNPDHPDEPARINIKISDRPGRR